MATGFEHSDECPRRFLDHYVRQTVSGPPTSNAFANESSRDVQRLVGLPNHVATDLWIGGVRLKDGFRVRDARLSQAQPLGFDHVRKQARHAETENADLAIE